MTKEERLHETHVETLDDQMTDRRGKKIKIKKKKLQLGVGKFPTSFRS